MFRESNAYGSAAGMRHADGSINFRLHPGHFRMLKNVIKALVCEPDSKTKAIGENLHKTNSNK